jgi:hypothetical protein
MFEIFADDVDRGTRFGMMFNRSDEPSNLLLENYPWEYASTVVDVGGSHGSVSIAISDRFPHIKCVVQDLPDTVKEGAARLPASLQERVEFMVQYVCPRTAVLDETHRAQRLLHTSTGHSRRVLFPFDIPQLER